jgi:CheY-like chemotaxis protein
MGQGSKFTLRLPKTIEDAQEAPAELPPRAETNQANDLTARGPVLCIEPDQPNMALMHDLLTDAGFQVVTAYNGADGIRLASAGNPSVITLELNLPDMDGWDALRRLTTDPATAEVPIVLVTIVDEKTRGLALGASGYLVKPFNRAQLIESVKTATERSTRVRLSDGTGLSHSKRRTGRATGAAV